MHTVCSDLGNRPMGGLWGEGYTGLVIESRTVIGHWTQTMGGLKRIWSVSVPLLPAVLHDSGKYGAKRPRCTLWDGPVHLEDWPGCLQSAAPPPVHVRQRDLNYLWKGKCSHISHQLNQLSFRACFPTKGTLY